MSDDAPTGDPAADAGIPPAPTPPAPAPARTAPPAQTAAPAAQAPAASGGGLSLAEQGITPQSLAAALAAQQPRHASDSDRDISRLPQWAQTEIRKARDGEAGYRVRYREAEQAGTELRQTIADAAGLDVSEVTADSLQDLFAYAAGAAQRAEVTQAALVAAVEHGLDPAALLKWQPFLDAADTLDPTADDFRTTVGSLVRETGESTPILRALQAGQEPARGVPSRSGAPIPGGSGNQPQITMEDVNAMAADGQFERIDALRREGKLSHLI
ncbi:hypothetical protein [Frankia sp. AgB32]|uniref:hypothetical protein n=1 Tax=Frankia sp. AgB32 TaxID=631119 RepID=UPI00200EFF77|nr:hypothetical protein [Frankia sp. AgB32]MCK9896961.1 hypothetical protein [Frankia sp. AgB32]